MHDEIVEAIRNPFFLIYLSVFLSLCVSGSTQATDAIESEFLSYRLQGYEVSGNVYGSKNFKIQNEAVTLDSLLLRKCGVGSWRDLLKKDFDELFGTAVGSVLILIPQDLSTLSQEDKKLFLEFEKKLATVKTDLAVYAAPATEELQYVLTSIRSDTSRAPTAFQQLLESLSANTFQLSTVENAVPPSKSYVPVNVIARLDSGDRDSETLVISANYDSHSVFPGASSGSDSNGSGVVALLELLAVISKYYENKDTRPPYNIVFLFSTAGKFNYAGTKNYIDSLGSSNVRLALCLDSIGGPGALHMHVSKMPGEGSLASELHRRLNAVSSSDVEIVTKKISLKAEQMNWEHESFNAKRIAAVTLSALASSEEAPRRSLLDVPSQISIDNLERNIRTIAEAFLGYILNTPSISHDSRVTVDSSILPEDAIDRHRISHFVRQFATKPRSVLDEQGSQLVSRNLLAAAKNYAEAGTVQVPLTDVTMYGGLRNKILAEQVKPAVFELFVAAGVFAYLAVFYHISTVSQHLVENVVSSLRKRV